MKNLKLLSFQHEETVHADCFCLDHDGNTYFASSSNLFLKEKNSNKVSVCSELASDSNSNEHFIIGMEYLLETDNIFIASSCGEIYSYDIYTKEVSTVGFVDSGLEGFAWSPDQEFVVLLTGANSLILMTKGIDAVAEKSLCTDEFGESKPVTVGWGSKETQFHGSEGKEAAHVKKIDPKPALSYDDHRPRISWRGDGEYFVTSSVHSIKGYRQLHVWSREAVLQFTSEIKEGLEEPICWRPVGNVIACSQQDVNKHKVIFFEKNGLQHGEFTLPFKPNTFRVTRLLWNVSCTVLLVVAEELIESPSYFQVMLWTCSNYHWYLKQSFQLQNGSPYAPLVTLWSTYHPCELYSYNKATMEFCRIQWTLMVHHNPGFNRCVDGLVISVDNDNILITPFGKMVVPPPLCGYSYSLPSSVHSVFFSPDSYKFGCYLGNSKLAFYQKESLTETLNVSDYCKLKLVAAGSNGFKFNALPYSFSGYCNLYLQKLNTAGFGLCHWTWIKNNKLLCVNHSKQDSSSFFEMLLIKLPQKFLGSDSELVPSLSTELDCSVIGMCANYDGSIIAVQLSSGKVLRYENEATSESPLLSFLPWLCDDGSHLILPQPCPCMSIINIHNKDYFLGLTERYNLFCDNIRILTNCTSYYIHDEFLLATTTDHLLKCFSKDWDILELFKNQSVPQFQIQEQRIEKGAKIIIAPSNSTKVILQMPRGNLETIHPRPLVLSSVCKHLDKLQFGDAFNLSKVHRIDLNIMYDHNPKQFLDNVEKVIEQINSATSLNLFLASLKNEDICKTLYPLAYKCKQQIHSDLLGNKVDIICHSFREVLEKKNDNRYYITLIATYAKKSEPELDQALLRLKNLRDSNNDKSTQSLVDSALNFLLYLVDVNELIDVALGTYDLETTIMVAQKSQKDPKEFLPFYNDLRKMEENYKKYKIDMHLQRYKLALQHISKCEGHFEECLSLIRDQRLYIDSLYLFQPSDDRYKIIWEEYGTYLMDKRYFEEAGLVFTRCGNHEQALLSYKESLNWQSMLCAAVNLNYSDEKIISLCLEISEKLKSNQRFVDASYLLEHYVKDVEESIVTLIEGCEWITALLLMSKYKRNDISETHLKPALNEHLSYLTSYLDQCSKDFYSHTERLKFLRTQKKQESELPDHMKHNEDELFSETGSVTDAASSYAESKQLSGSIMTRKSSKSRRKQKLKKYRLKEGSPDEDLAHISTLYEIVIKIDNLKDNFLNTLKSLVQFGYDRQAKLLQDKMVSLVSVVESEMPNIWQPLENKCPSPELKFGPDSTANSITASLQLQANTGSTGNMDADLSVPPWRKVDLTLQMFR